MCVFSKLTSSISNWANGTFGSPSRGYYSKVPQKRPQKRHPAGGELLQLLQDHEQEIGAEELVPLLLFQLPLHRPAARVDAAFVTDEPLVRGGGTHVRGHERLHERAHPRRVELGALLGALHQAQPRLFRVQCQIFQELQADDLEAAHGVDAGAHLLRVRDVDREVESVTRLLRYYALRACPPAYQKSF